MHFKLWHQHSTIIKENHEHMYGLDLYITILLVMNVVYNNKIIHMHCYLFF
jgi:hypothetical protein